MINSIDVVTKSSKVVDGVTRDSDELPSWAGPSGYLPCNEDEATHLVVGVGEVSFGKSGAGILAYCDNEFQAYRCAREIRKDPRAEVLVLVNSFELRSQITMVLREMLMELTVKYPKESGCVREKPEEIS